jgi:hypothetical protein
LLLTDGRHDDVLCFPYAYVSCRLFSRLSSPTRKMIVGVFFLCSGD